MNRYGFIAAAPKAGDYIHGDNKLGTVALMPSGDWSQYLPPDEMQNRGYETYSCVSEATLHCVEILERFEYQTAPHYAVRFLASITGTGNKQGNDFGTVSEALRTSGCCVETDYPFDAPDYSTFYQPIPSQIVKLSKVQFADNSYGHSWLTDTSPESMMSALTFSPLSLSVFAWPVISPDGIYRRPQGAPDCHAITVYGYEQGVCWHIFDSYDKTHKKLAWDYGFGMGKRHTLRRAIPTAPNPDTGWINWAVFLDYCRRLLGIPLEGDSLGAARSPHWPTVRNAFIKAHPSCAVCGRQGTVLKPNNVHHCQVFHLHPERELDPRNLITLCREHHLLVGHLMDWASYNESVRQDAATWDSKIATRP